jgi:hypothetical protein
MAAVCGNNMTIVKYLVEKVNANIHSYCISNSWFDSGSEQTALSLAIGENPDIVKFLLETNSSLVHCPALLVNIATTRAWNESISNEIITLLLDRGYDVNGMVGEVSRSFVSLFCRPR